ncbi:MAG: class I SAM-dependent methyltransferase [Gaiellaceae bacterium]
MEPTEHNRRAWDEVHRRRAESMREQLGIPPLVRERLPSLEGKHVLHLQCATGESTAELVDLGALVSAVDISAEALAVGRERTPSVAWVHADVHALPLELRRARFHLVYTGGGVLYWLHDLDAWAGGIVAALRPGGYLVLYDEHPVLGCLDAALRWREDYFDETVHVDVGWEHFELTGEPAHEPKHERFWRLGQIVTALARAGLTIRRLEEFPSLHSERRQDPRVPGEFILVARKG